MNTKEFDYYLIESDENYLSPLLMNDDDVESGATAFLRRYKPIDENIVTHLVFNPPIPPKPDMTDYLNLNCRAVFSTKIRDVLKEISIKDFQLVPAIVKDPKGNEYSDYWIANTYRKYAFLDKDKSEYGSITSKGSWSMIKKMVVDEERMSKVLLADRNQFTIFDGNRNKYFRILLISSYESMKNHRDDIKNTLVKVRVYQSQLNDPNYGTRESPIPILYLEIPKYKNSPTYWMIEKTPEKYRETVYYYLAYIMPKDEFKQRFSNRTNN